LSFVNNQEVRRAFQQSIVASFTQRCEDRSGSQREDVESNNTVTPILADYLDYTVDDLRALVVSAVKSGNSKDFVWGQINYQPLWWPAEVPYLDPNNAGKKALKMNELIAVMNSYGNHMQQTAVARVTAICISATLTSVTTTATTATMSVDPTTTTVITTSNATPPPPPPPTTTTTTNSGSTTGPTAAASGATGGPASQHSLQQHQDHQQLRQSIDCLVAGQQVWSGECLCL